MNAKMRLLMSCRDPGSTGHMIELVRLFKEDGRFDVSIAASGVGFDILSKVHPETQRFVFGDGVDHLKSKDDPTPLLDAARNLIESVNPDAVFVGLSSLGCGIDEALLASANGRPSFLFQEFWGDINEMLGVRADVTFVLDEYAREVTKERWKQESHAVGSPRHSAYAAMDVDAMRETTRSRLGIAPDRIAIGFFSQTSQVAGHEDAFLDLTRAIYEMNSKPVFLMREHPKFREDSVAHLRRLTSLGIEVLDVTDEPQVEPILAACDVVSTCYSSCAFDHAYLSAYARKPIGTTVFLLTNPEIRAEHMRLCGFPFFPTVAQGMGLVASSFEELKAVLDLAIRDNAKEGYHLASKKLSDLYRPDLITSTVAEHIAAARMSGITAI